MLLYAITLNTTQTPKSSEECPFYRILRNYPRIEVFLFKENRYVLFFQLPDIFQAVQRVPCKPADGFCNDHVNPACHAFFNHAVKFTAFFCITAADPVIRKYARQLPFRVFLDELGVMFHLDFIAACLLVTVCGDTAIGGNPEFWFFFFGHSVSHPFPGRNNRNILIQFHSFPPRSLSGCRHRQPVQRGSHRPFSRQA